MVDLETLGTTADAVIMSIGAVRFDPDTDALDMENAFYASVSIESNHEGARRHISEDTLLWWLKQSPQAQAVFHEPKDTLRSALESLSDWISTDDNHMWSNGADFDLPMLAHAYKQFGQEPPWKFWNNRCYRTMKGMPFAKRAGKIEVGVKHNAVTDAYNQARHLQAIYVAMKEPA